MCKDMARLEAQRQELSDRITNLQASIFKGSEKLDQVGQHVCRNATLHSSSSPMFCAGCPALLQDCRCSYAMPVHSSNSSRCHCLCPSIHMCWG